MGWRVFVYTHVYLISCMVSEWFCGSEDWLVVRSVVQRRVFSPGHRSSECSYNRRVRWCNQSLGWWPHHMNTVISHKRKTQPLDHKIPIRVKTFLKQIDQPGQHRCLLCSSPHSLLVQRQNIPLYDLKWIFHVRIIFVRWAGVIYSSSISPGIDPCPLRLRGVGWGQMGLSLTSCWLVSKCSSVRTSPRGRSSSESPSSILSFPNVWYFIVYIGNIILTHTSITPKLFDAFTLQQMQTWMNLYPEMHVYLGKWVHMSPGPMAHWHNITHVCVTMVKTHTMYCVPLPMSHYPTLANKYVISTTSSTNN